MPSLPTYAVIMAGGQGTRFWPASRRQRPKQFLPILGRRTMLQETLARLTRACPPTRTLVVTGAEHVRLARGQAPGLPAANVIGEPVGRSTAPCVALAAELILQRERDAVMLVLPADHAIAERAAFQRVLRRAIGLAEAGMLATIGVSPTSAETGYGYIEVGERIGVGKPDAHRVQAFHEKPDRTTAERYYASGRFLWNAGIFAWRATVIRDEIRRHLPRVASAFAALGRARSRRERKAALRRAYSRVDSVSVDHGVMEKADNVGVVVGDMGWNDVGSWDAIAEVWRADADGNAVRGDVLALDSRRDVVLADANRLVALLGMEDCVVVDTPEALLICPRERAQDVRSIVEELKRRRRREFL